MVSWSGSSLRRYARSCRGSRSFCVVIRRAPPPSHPQLLPPFPLRLYWSSHPSEHQHRRDPLQRLRRLPHPLLAEQTLRLSLSPQRPSSRHPALPHEGPLTLNPPLTPPLRAPALPAAAPRLDQRPHRLPQPPQPLPAHRVRTTVTQRRRYRRRQLTTSSSLRFFPTSPRPHRRSLPHPRLRLSSHHWHGTPLTTVSSSLPTMHRQSPLSQLMSHPREELQAPKQLRQPLRRPRHHRRIFQH
jgi:hypothetical protein